MHLSVRLSAPCNPPSTITSCTLHCTFSPLAPPSIALVAPLTAPSGPYRGQGASWACCWRIAGSGMGAVGDGPIGCPSRARTVPELHQVLAMQHPSRVLACTLGARLVQLYRAWACVGKHVVLRVNICPFYPLIMGHKLLIWMIIWQ